MGPIIAVTHSYGMFSAYLPGPCHGVSESKASLFCRMLFVMHQAGTA